jgi:hypothetical protein
LTEEIEDLFASSLMSVGSKLMKYWVVRAGKDGGQK